LLWPDLQDYNESVQTPGQSFSDPALQRAVPSLNKLGLPAPRSGNFATVYQLRDGAAAWAVRCFTRGEDYKRRYAAIQRHLSGHGLRQLVSFEYQDAGIRVRGRWYPLVKMQWVDGVALNAYVGDHVDDPTVLRDLSRQWLELTRGLREAQMAHGDLQHGNVLVEAGQLRLVDYDGVFVPEFAGERSPEEGHPNYQSPRRRDDFGPELDGFSGWVIFLSLYALSVAPYLWDQLDAGDECLLLRRADFEHPDQSAGLRALEEVGDHRLLQLVGHFRKVLECPPLRVPPVDVECSLGRPALSGAAPAERQWWRDWTGREAPPGSEGSTGEVAPAPSAGSGLDWLFDHVGDPSAELPGTRLDCGVLADRLVAAGGAAGALLGLGASAIGAAAPSLGWSGAGAAASVAALVLGLRYLSCPAARAKRRLRRELRRRRAELRRAEVVAAQLQQRLAAESRKRQSRLADLRSQVATAHRDETRSLQRLRDDADKAKARCAAQQSQLDANFQATVKRELESARSQYLLQGLSHHSIQSLDAPGIGDGLKGNLMRAGVVTAAQVSWSSVRRVYGFAEARTRAVVEWREWLQRELLAAAPSQLPPDRMAQLERGRAAEGALLQARARAADSELQAKCDDVRRRSSEHRQALQRRITELENEDRKQHDLGAAEARRASKDLFGPKWRLANAEKRLAAYRGIALRAYVARVLGLVRTGGP